MAHLWKKYWFLILLAAVLLVGFRFAAQLTTLADAATLRNLIVAGVLFMTTLVLHTSAISAAIRRPTAAVLGIAINFILVPLLAWAMASLLQTELGLGLAVTAAAPCTLASAAVWTRRAGGNDAVAIMVTVVTNLMCFVVTPMWLTLIARQIGDVEINLWEMIEKLGLLVVVPMIVAQLGRRIRTVAIWADGNREWLGIASQAGILVIVLMGAIKCGLRLSEVDHADEIRSWDYVVMWLVVTVLHLAALLIGQWLARGIGLPREEWIAVGFAGSQKTLMVGLHVALLAGGGLLILPMVAYHVSQLLIDTIAADRLKR